MNDVAILVSETLPYHIRNIDHYIGREIARSRWIEIDQGRVNRFALCTDDHNPLHVDLDWATRNGPFGGTIAHGFLTLSMLSHFAYEEQMMPAGIAYSINYGFERIRFMSPVKVGDRIRNLIQLQSAENRGHGRWVFRSRNTIEIESIGKPAMMAVWLTLFVEEGASAVVQEAV